jgi:hypothetical protein
MVAFVVAGGRPSAHAACLRAALGTERCRLDEIYFELEAIWELDSLRAMD